MSSNLIVFLRVNHCAHYFWSVRFIVISFAGIYTVSRLFTTIWAFDFILVNAHFGTVMKLADIGCNWPICILNHRQGCNWPSNSLWILSKLGINRANISSVKWSARILAMTLTRLLFLPLSYHIFVNNIWISGLDFGHARSSFGVRIPALSACAFSVWAHAFGVGILSVRAVWLISFTFGILDLTTRTSIFAFRIFNLTSWTSVLVVGILFIRTHFPVFQLFWAIFSVRIHIWVRIHCILLSIECWTFT